MTPTVPDGPDTELTAATARIVEVLSGPCCPDCGVRVDGDVLAEVRAVLARPAAAPTDGQHPAAGPEYAIIETNRGGGVEYPVAERNTNGPAGWRVGGEFVPDSAVTHIDPVTVTRAAPADDTAAPRSVAELPATLRTVEDVADVCQAAGLPSGDMLWEDESVSVVADAGYDPHTGTYDTSLATVHVQRADEVDVAVLHPGVPSSLLLAAIRAAQGGTQ